MTTSNFLLLLRRCRWAALLPALLLFGCQTPDLKPFATATSALATAVKQGGDLATGPLLSDPMIVNGNVVATDDPAHPGRQLQKEWNARRASAEAMLVYSASLAAISEAADKRKENAEALTGAVKQLASSIPGVAVGVGAAGDLSVKVVEEGIEVFVEVKAWHDMKKAVRAADPAIQKIGGVLQRDFATLGATYSTAIDGKIIVVQNSLRAPSRLYDRLIAARDAQRATVGGAPGDQGAGAELTRLDTLIAGVEPEVTQKRAELAELLAHLEQGKQFFAASAAAVEAWMTAHRDIVTAFEEKRLPNLVLLEARAQELISLVDQFKAIRRSTP